jgi:DNA repair protein RadC
MAKRTTKHGLDDAAGLFPLEPPEKLYEGHRERLRVRFMTEPDAIPDYELLEMLLAAARPRVDTKPEAKALLKQFNNSFAEVISADPQALRAVKGVGEASVVVLKAVREAALRLLRPKPLHTDLISSWSALVDYLTARTAYEATEQFRVIYLNRKNQLIADEAQGEGTVDHTPVYPREVVKRALELNASALIMVHNHPSGDPKPSRADVEMTRKVKDAAAAVGLVLHDHVIVSRGGTVSFRTEGLL